METINNIELRDGTSYPDEKVFKLILGKSYNTYLSLLKLFDDYGLEYGWRYYKDGKAWLCKVQRKKRTIVWMSAWKGYMQATIYFPEKYLKNLYELDITDEMKNKIRETKNVGKSKPCIFEIRNMKVLKDIDKVIQYKLIAK